MPAHAFASAGGAHGSGEAENRTGGDLWGGAGGSVGGRPDPIRGFLCSCTKSPLVGKIWDGQPTGEGDPGPPVGPAQAAQDAARAAPLRLAPGGVKTQGRPGSSAGRRVGGDGMAIFSQARSLIDMMWAERRNCGADASCVAGVSPSGGLKAVLATPTLVREALRCSKHHLVSSLSPRTGRVKPRWVFTSADGHHLPRPNL